MPRYLLDTNAWITLLKGRSTSLNARISRVSPNEIALCSILKFELWHGANKYANRNERQLVLQSLFEQHISFGFDDDAAKIASEIRHTLELKGQMVGPMDTLIASIAIANNVVLVTNNREEFARIENLRIEDWTT
jgi:tRNA(fMet)-specific endonuclease VapC